MATDSRERILDAARKVFAEHGSTGATTRRIAEEAGVNEVTLFRQFGSKENLLEEAARAHVTGDHAVPLPERPVHPERELTVWCAREIERLRESREFILQCLAEETKHPELGETGAVPMAQIAAELSRYVDALAHDHRLASGEESGAAMTMLLGAMYSDALGRANIPGVVTVSPAEAPGLYVRLFLRALTIRVLDRAV